MKVTFLSKFCPLQGLILPPRKKVIRNVPFLSLFLFSAQEKYLGVSHQGSPISFTKEVCSLKGQEEREKQPKKCKNSEER